MKQEELIKVLIKELLQMEEVHYEYTENDKTYVLDSEKNGNELNIKVSINENKDKSEFENWANQLDDDIFEEVWQSLSEECNLHDLNELYESDNYKEVIDKFKDMTKKVITNKINNYKKLISY